MAVFSAGHVVFLAVAAWFCRAGAQGQCASHTVLKEPWRLDSVATDQTNPRCDDNLQSGWYRFDVPGGNGRMTSVPDKSKAVPSFSCGTVLPLAFIGTHPSVDDGIVEREMCYNFGDDVCSLFSLFSEKIRIRNCGNFFVYKLFPPPCTQAFCAATKAEEVLAPSKPTIDDVDGQFVFKCLYQKSSNKDYTITWYVEDDVVYSQYMSGKSDNVPTLPVKALSNNIGPSSKMLACTATVGKTQSPKSEGYDLNVEAKLRRNKRAVFYEADEDEIVIESTIPMDCTDCDIAVDMDQSESFVADQCTRSLNDMKWDGQRATMSFRVKAVSQYGERDGSQKIRMNVGMAKVSNKRAGAAYTDLVFPGITTEVVIKGTETCTPHGDPHYRSFGNKKYDNYQTGDYVMYQDDDHGTKITVTHTKCGRASCVCGFEATEGAEVVRVEVCNNHRLPEVTLTGNDPQTRVFKESGGKRYNVHLPSGNYISAWLSYYSSTPILNLNVQRAKQHRKVTGTCGTISNKDLFVGPKGNTITPRVAKRPDEFFQNWKVSSKKRVFDQDPHDIIKRAKVNPKQFKNFCRCTRDYRGNVKSTCSKTFNYKSTHLDFDVRSPFAREMTPSLKQKMRLRRNVDYQDHLARRDLRYDHLDDDVKEVRRRDNPAWPTPNGITKLDAKVHCQKLFTTKKATACAAALETGFDTFVADCLEDIYYMDSLEAGTAVAATLDTICKDALVDKKNYTSLYDNGTPIFADVFGSFCPGACSFHGKCQLGKCTCDPGYGAEDCSVDLKQPPTVDGVIGGHACDTFYNLCMEVKMTVFNAHNSTGLRCRFSSQTGGQSYAETALAAYENFREVKCRLPYNMNLVITGMETVQVVKVSLANDGKKFGTDTKFTIYDSDRCYKCDDKGDCTLKPLKCFIGNKCYNAGETHPTNSAVSCEPGTSVDHWVDITGHIVTDA